MKRRTAAILTACSLALIGSMQSGQASAADPVSSAQANPDDARDALNIVNGGTRVIQQMKADQQLTALMRRAKGIFVVPDYGKGALVVGGQGGEGALMVREGTKWTGPVFYTIGGVTVGAQVGGEGGSIAMLLMTDRALNRFKRDNNFSLIADADLTIVDYSVQAQGSVANGDVVRWSDTEGAYAGASVGVTDINYDQHANNSYYRTGDVTSYRILHGEVANPHTETLAEALPG